MGDPVSSPVMVVINEDDDVLTYEIVMNVKTDSVAREQGEAMDLDNASPPTHYR